jgi:hypothetical protein
VGRGVRHAHGSCIENGEFGNVGKPAAAPGAYVLVTGDPTALAEKSGGVIPQQFIAVLRVEP